MYCTRHATHLDKLIILAGRGVLVIIHSVIAATAIKRLKEDDGGWSEKGESGRDNTRGWRDKIRGSGDHIGWRMYCTTFE